MGKKEEEVQMFSLNNNVEVENTVKFISSRDFHLEFSKGKTISKTASKVATEVAWVVTRLFIFDEFV